MTTSTGPPHQPPRNIAGRPAEFRATLLCIACRLTPTEKGIINDCLESIKESIDELKDSLSSMKNLGVKGADMQAQLDDIKTWVSAVITDDVTCTDGFDGLKVSTAVKTPINNSIVYVARLASNALSLIDSLIY
nr:21 kDa protein [Malus domestica]